jgi:hypothetical protein
MSFCSKNRLQVNKSFLIAPCRPLLKEYVDKLQQMPILYQSQQSPRCMTQNTDTKVQKYMLQMRCNLVKNIIHPLTFIKEYV